MRSTVTLMIDYARYHRDPRNIATHMVGIPLIVLSLGVLLAKPAIPLVATGALPWLTLSPGWALWAAATLWYLTRGSLLLSVAVCLWNALLIAAGQWLAVLSGGHWLQWGAGLFALGWLIQFIGHYYEGRKPAFVDDLVGLLVGPMFVVAEILFSVGLLKDLRETIEVEAGPVTLRDLHASAVR